MRLRLGIACIVVAVLLGIIAATSYHLATPATVLALIFAVLGLGLIDEATDPRRKPNPRTALMSPSEFARLCARIGYPRESWAGLYRWYRSEAGRPLDG